MLLMLDKHFYVMGHAWQIEEPTLYIQWSYCPTSTVERSTTQGEGAHLATSQVEEAFIT